jgi:acyl transferase domain-containing protein/NAD(P)-dependent dehydrogenase (short-subunit alcohol dehydrogenase family)/acyl carrier protein
LPQIVAGGGREPIAIVGIGCRFPGGADDPRSLWRLLANGVDAITEVPAERFTIGPFFDPDPTRPGTTVSRWGGFVRQRVEDFDALFFGISPREAARMDPLQRWLLEVSWEALEDGGQVAERLAGSDTGVFVGVFAEDMKLVHLGERNLHLIDSYTGTGTAMTLVANRISYLLDLRGPSVALDTACSSSLVAVHYACQSLWNGECALALAGGVNAIFRPEFMIAESKAGMLSPDGRSKAFDAQANGYVRGEGAAMVVLKPAAIALADGDPIYAVILGSAVNQDGKTVGITVPSRTAQESLMAEACRRAGVAPARIQYVEAHGTGTPVGDPLEMNALAAVLASGRPPGDKCWIGSIKTNIGHLEAAAGIAGLIKAALCLQQRAIPPHLHFRQPHPGIPLADLCVRIPLQLEPWPAHSGPAYAAVNSFGFGGTNAHVILAEAPAAPPADCCDEAAAGSPYLMPLSARSPEALDALARGYLDLLRDPRSGPSCLRDLCFTAGVRRGHHSHRLACVVHSPEELAEQLASHLAGDGQAGTSSGYSTPGHRPKIAFLFSGMGPQWWAMGRQLLAEEPVFRTAIESCDELLRRHVPWSLLAELQAEEACSRMDETQIAQPANFALQVGLTALWRARGVVPDAVVGHSAGEVAAAHCAGVLTLPDAVRLIFHRSRLQQRTSGEGRLAAVALSLPEARQALCGYEDRVSIAAINSPSSLTLVGDPAALASVVELLESRGIFCRFLRGGVPYHSHYLEPLREELLQSLAELSPRTAALEFFSTVTGQAAAGPELTADFWWRNMREPVCFAPAVAGLIEGGCEIFIEIGPHPTLASSISECLLSAGRQATVLASLHRDRGESATLLEALGAVYARGSRVEWRELYPQGRHVHLPLYPWQRERHWVEGLGAADEVAVQRLQVRPAAGERPPHPLLGRRLQTAVPAWEAQVDPRSLHYLDDHRIEGAVVYPGAAFVEMALAAGREIAGVAETGHMEFAEIEFKKALFLSEVPAATLQLVLDPRSLTYAISSAPSAPGQPWTLHATGRRRSGARSGSAVADLAALRGRCRTEIPAEACYARFRAMGLHYGPSFQGIERLWQGAGEALAQVLVPAAVAAELPAYHIHPAVLDVSFQVLAANAIASGAGEPEATQTYMPVAAERFALHRRPQPRMWVHARVSEHSEEVLCGDIRLLDEAGNVVAEVDGLRGVALAPRGLVIEPSAAELFYALEWRVRESLPDSAASSAAVPGESGCWLIFADGDGGVDSVGRALASRLTARGAICITVLPGTAYHFSREEELCRLDASDGGHLRRLLADAADGQEEPRRCRGVVHLWGLDAPAAEELTVAGLAAAETATCIAVINLVQALDQARWRELPRLWLITCGAQSVTAEDAPVAVAQTPLWGLGRTIAHQEHPELWGALIDLEPGTASPDAATLIALEIGHADPLGEVALRGGQRYVSRLVHRRELAAPSLPVRLRSDAAYLITGGLGGLGLRIARWLVEQGARRLILMGRTPLPARALWQEVAEPAAAGRIAAVRQLEAMGASVHLAQVDLADEGELAAFLATYRREGWPPIRGVLHLAGISQPQMLLQMTPQGFTDGLRPKVTGAWLLHRLMAGERLDFFVLFSSVAALGFSMGQSSYAAGNAFLDGLAHYRRALGLPALSINWGAWAEVGMASLLDGFRDIVNRGFIPMLPAQGIAALASLLGRQLVQATVIGADWPQASRKNYPMGVAPPLLDELLAAAEQAISAVAAGDPEVADIVEQVLLTTDPVARLELLRSHLHGLVARVLRLDAARLDPEQSLTGLGLDSMTAVELRNRVDRSLGVTPSVVELLQGASVNSLAALLLPDLATAAEAELAGLLAEIADLSGGLDPSAVEVVL